MRDTDQNTDEVKAVGTGVVVSDEALLRELGLGEFTQEEKKDNYPILSLLGTLEAGTEREPNAVYAGETVIGEFIGTVPMWSLEPKENWKEEEAEGRKYWTSLHYKFINRTTKEAFGLFSSSTLFILQKIPTIVSGLVTVNPIVGVKYLGKIEGKEILEKEYGVVITKGNSAHVCRPLMTSEVQKSTDSYRAGCINYTRSPLPNFGSKVKMSKIEQAKVNFAAQEARQNDRAIEAQAQLIQ